MSFDPFEFDRNLTSAGQVETIGQYTAKTFLWMVLGLLITFGVAVACWMSGAVFYVYQAHLVILIATLALSITMVTRIERMTVGMAMAIFVAFSVLFGLTMSIYLVLFEVTSLVFVFLATSVYFGALAAYGYLTKRDLSTYRTILFSGLIFLLAFAVLSWFIPWLSAFDQIICLVGIVVFLGYTAYDTQKIREFYYYYAGYPDMLEKASIFSALQLYLDFLNLFLYLLRFLGKRKN